MTPLAVVPEHVSYGPKDHDRLQSDLEQRAVATQLRKLQRHEDIQLALDGSIHGYRLTTVALNQLCQKLARGLTGFVFDVAGLYMTAGQTDPRLAVHLINQMIRLRFRETLLGQQILCDAANRIIEGVVGPSYRLITNFDLLQQCDSVLLPGKAFVFREAVRLGRRFYLRYLQTKPAIVLDGPVADPHYLGIICQNSESGSISLSGAPCIWRERTQTYALAQHIHAISLPHLVGSAALRKFRSFVVRTQGRVATVKPHLGRLSQLKGISLGIREPGEQYSKQREALVRLLRSCRLSRDESVTVLDLALQKGAYPEPPVYAEEAQFERCKSRTMFDLYYALGKVAAGMPPIARNKLELAAYRLLTRNFEENL